ncbi:hypothetical protein ACJJTC_007857 [Scirpophaga incertulas]
MTFVCFIFLSALSWASISGATLDNVPIVTSVTHYLSGYELSMSASASNELANESTNEIRAMVENERNQLSDRIKTWLESFRNVVINGNALLPPLDPFVVEQIGPYLFTASGIQLSGEVRNLKTEGLMWYVIDDVVVSALRLTLRFHVTVPRITVTGNYGTSATVAIINHKAGGDFRIFLHRIVLGFDMRVGTRILSGELFLRELNIIVDVHDTFINIEGMTGSPIINGVLNSIIQRVTQQTIQNQLKNFSEIISRELFDIIDNFLRDFSLSDILG